jgi:hypothetical protein
LNLRTDLRSKTEPEFVVRAKIADQAKWYNSPRILPCTFAVAVVLALLLQWHDYFQFDVYPYPDEKRTVLDDCPSLGPAVSDDHAVYQGRYLKVLERTKR